MKSLEKKYKKNGFSILEVIAAIFIISLGLIGVLSLILQNIQVQYVNRNMLIGTELAQEGIELIRNIRDDNWLAGRDWDNGLSPDNYIIDYTGSISSVSGISEAKLQIRDDLGEEGFYWHEATDNNSIFSRLITITTIDTNSSLVSSLVSWSERGRTHQYQTDTILYNWR
ncbi:MAG: prepilin-type N-terminal cleavage/methylation domain-containing protein [Patescibacteria group bacterium]